MRRPRRSLREIGFSVREISEKAGAMDDVVRFDIGQPDFGTPPPVREKILAHVEQDHITYTPLWGLPELREAIIDFDQHDRDLTTDHVMATTGGMGALYCIINGMLDTGDAFLTNDPAWAPYRMIAASSPGKMEQVPYFVDGHVNADGIRDAITEDTALMIINTPENPTGRVYTEDEVEELVAIAVEHDLHIIGDEVYNKILYGDAEHVSPAAFAPERTFTVNSLSKNFAMTGWRLGWLTFPDADVVNELGKVNRATTACPNYLAQQAGIIALTEAQDYTADMVEQYQQRRDLVVERMHELGWDCVTPHGAIYAFPGVHQDSWEFAHTLLEEAHVSVVPGEPFGTHSDTNVRLCFGSVGRDRLEAGFDRIADFIGESTNT